VGLFKGISKRTDTVFKSAARLATMRWHPLSRSRWRSRSTLELPGLIW